MDLNGYAEVTLDGCCGAGGGTLGLVRAGHYVVGVDTNPALRDSYLRSGAHEFICADILDVLDDQGFCERFTFGSFHPPCFPAGTPVITARGTVPIEDVAAGDRVLTHAGRWRPVTATMSRLALVAADGWLAATPEHPFLARRVVRSQRGRHLPPGISRAPGGGGLADPEWTPAGELEGTFLALPAVAEALPVPDSGCEQTVPFWYMVGRWLGDGWVTDRGPGAESRRSRYETHICCAIEEADGLESKLADTGLHWGRSPQRTTARFTAYGSLATWLTEHFGRYAHSKTLPGWLFGAPAWIRAAMLDGYRDADGSEIAARAGYWRLPTVSPCLAVGIRVLATTLGLPATLQMYQPHREAVIEGRPVAERPTWTVAVTPRERYGLTEHGHRWVRQRRPLLLRGVEQVYDITVAEDHSFTAWGYVVHNCQGYSAMMNCQPPEVRARYPRLIRPIKDRLAANWGGRPYTIENVESPLVRAELASPVTFCMWMFGRWTYRHRLIEASGFTAAPPPVPAWAWNPPTADHVRAKTVRVNRACGWPHPVPTERAGHWKPGCGKFVSVAGHERKEPVRAVMEIDEDWMPDREAVAEAVPWYMMAWVAAQLAAERRAVAA